jgi:uncharacterized protein (TIGR03032 family)
MTAGGAEARWDESARALRDPAQIVAQWEPATSPDPALLRARASRGWWELLAELGITLLVSREYEHLLIGMSAPEGRPHATHLALPHPSGIAIDPARARVYVASTRNPNQVYTFMPVTGSGTRKDRPHAPPPDRPLLPVASRFLPGSLYLHDLALIGGRLHGNAVGENAVVSIPADTQVERVWWPRCIETPSGPEFARNHIQLNSIAAGPDLASSFFSASASEMTSRRPGHRNFPVDGRGVIFSGTTREPVAGGLTRPHSARLHDGRLWVDNSGYGEVGVVADGRFDPVARLPGWTRGLCFAKGLAFVATSQVIPRFRQYAPGLDSERSVCSVFALDAATGEVRESIRWPGGNQIFAVEALPTGVTWGFPQGARRRSGSERMTRLFYSFETETKEKSKKR